MAECMISDTEFWTVRDECSQHGAYMYRVKKDESAVGCPVCQNAILKHKLDTIVKNNKELRDLIWSKTLKLTVEMNYSKSKQLLAKYELLKELWEALGGDRHQDDDHDDIKER